MSERRSAVWIAEWSLARPTIISSPGRPGLQGLFAGPEHCGFSFETMSVDSPLDRKTIWFFVMTVSLFPQVDRWLAAHHPQAK